MNAKKCDNCCKFYIYDNEPFRVHGTMSAFFLAISVLRLRINANGSDSLISADLCPECIRRLLPQLITKEE